MTSLIIVQARLHAAVGRLSSVRDLYLNQGVTADELYEAERIGQRAAGVAYALSVVEEAIDDLLDSQVLSDDDAGAAFLDAFAKEQHDGAASFEESLDGLADWPDPFGPSERD